MRLANNHQKTFFRHMGHESHSSDCSQVENVTISTGKLPTWGRTASSASSSMVLAFRVLKTVRTRVDRSYTHRLSFFLARLFRSSEAFFEKIMDLFSGRPARISFFCFSASVEKGLSDMFHDGGTFRGIHGLVSYWMVIAASWKEVRWTWENRGLDTPTIVYEILLKFYDIFDMSSINSALRWTLFLL